jgi:hypothetical protein
VLFAGPPVNDVMDLADSEAGQTKPRKAIAKLRRLLLPETRCHVYYLYDEREDETSSSPLTW